MPDHTAATSSATPSTDASTSPRRILLWAPWGSGRHYNGPGSFAYRMYRLAPPGRCRITLAHAYDEQPDDPLFAEQHFVTSMPASMNQRVRALRELMTYTRDARAFVREHARHADVFHGLSGFQVTMPAAYEAQKAGTPTAVFLTNAGADLGTKPGLRRLLGFAQRRQAMARQLSALIAMSTEMQDELLSYGVAESKIARIPMGVDLGRFHPANDQQERVDVRQERGWSDLPTVVFSGGLVPRKRPHLLIEAIAHARDQGTDIQVAFLGPDGPDEAYARSLRDCVQHHNVDSLVHFEGFVEDPTPLLRAADMFCLPSYQEGMPAALVEAMATGLAPVITSFSSALDLVSDGETGRLVDATPQAVGDALKAYADDDALRKRHAAQSRERALAMHGMERILERYLNLFDLIVAGKPAADA